MSGTASPQSLRPAQRISTPIGVASRSIGTPRTRCTDPLAEDDRKKDARISAQ
jgi:hypothetical protein